MQIKEFKKHDIIQRTVPTMDGNPGYIGKRLRFLGSEKNVIFARLLNPRFCRNSVLLIGGSKWFDDGWDYFPEDLYQALKQENKERIEANQKKAKEELEFKEKKEDEEDEDEDEEKE